MRIQGIIVGDGGRARDERLQKILKEAFDSIDHVIKTEADAPISRRAELIYASSTKSKLGRLLRDSDGALFVVYADEIARLQMMFDHLVAIDPIEKYNLVGKWVGFVIVDQANPLLIEPYTSRLLGSVNRLGMIPLPHAIRTLKNSRSAEHKLLGRDLALVLSNQHEWEGRSIWDTIAA